MRRVLLVALMLLTLAPRPALAQARYDVLIVGNRNNPQQKAILHQLRQEFEKVRADSNLTSEELPVDEYNTVGTGHGALQHLGLSTLKLPIIGVAVLGADGHPATMLATIAGVENAKDAVKKLVAACKGHIALVTGTEQEPSPASPPTYAIDPLLAGTYTRDVTVQNVHLHIRWELHADGTGVMVGSGPGVQSAVLETDRFDQFANGRYRRVVLSGKDAGKTEEGAYTLGDRELVTVPDGKTGGVWTRSP